MVEQEINNHLFPALRTHSLILQQPGVDALHVIRVLAGQDSQLVADHIIVEANATGFIVSLVTSHKLLGWDLFQARLWQPVPSLSPAVLDALEDHDAEHDDEADANDDGKGEEVGVDIKGLVVSQSHHKSSTARFISVVVHHFFPISVTNKYRWDHIVSIST